MPTDNSDLLSCSGNDMEPNFDNVSDINENLEVQNGIFYPSLEGEEPLQRLVMEGQSPAMTPDSMNYDFSSLEPPQGGSNMIITGRRPPPKQSLAVDLNYETLDYPMPNTVRSSLSHSPMLPTESSVSHLDNPENGSQSNNRDGLHSIGDTFEWPSVFDPWPLQHQQQTPISRDTNVLSSPTRADMQTIIRLEGADPSTVSAVMGVLIESKARFKIERH